MYFPLSVFVKIFKFNYGEFFYFLFIHIKSHARWKKRLLSTTIVNKRILLHEHYITLKTQSDFNFSKSQACNLVD